MRDSGSSFQDLTDEAFADLLKKHKQPVGLKAALQERVERLPRRARAPLLKGRNISWRPWRGNGRPTISPSCYMPGVSARRRQKVAPSDMCFDSDLDGENNRRSVRPKKGCDVGLQAGPLETRIAPFLARTDRDSPQPESSTMRLEPLTMLASAGSPIIRSPMTREHESGRAFPASGRQENFSLSEGRLSRREPLDPLIIFPSMSDAGRLVIHLRVTGR